MFGMTDDKGRFGVSYPFARSTASPCRLLRGRDGHFSSNESQDSHMSERQHRLAHVRTSYVTYSYVSFVPWSIQKT